LKCDNKFQIAPLKFENGFFIFEILKCKGDLNIKKLTKEGGGENDGEGGQLYSGARYCDEQVGGGFIHLQNYGFTIYRLNSL